MEHTISHSWRRRPFTPFNSKKRKVLKIYQCWRKQKSVTPLDCNRQGDRWKTSICTETYLYQKLFLHFLFTTKYCQTFYITFYYKMFLCHNLRLPMSSELCVCVCVYLWGCVCMVNSPFNPLRVSNNRHLSQSHSSSALGRDSSALP